VRAVVTLVLALAAAPLPAHHSFTTLYLEQDTIEIEGEIIEFQYQNPHSWVHVNGQDAFGRRRAFAAEWGSRASLENFDIRKDTLRAGDVVRIWASPNRNPNDNRIRLRRIERPRDGWKWSQASRPEER
jgi:hypothetical protein